MASIHEEGILIAQGTADHAAARCFLRPDKANRHGLITGATGTGKTITLQTLAEGFSGIGVPVFMADVKGDLTGISQAGVLSDKLAKIIRERSLEAPAFAAFPTHCGTCSGNRATRCAPRSATSGPCCWRACSTSTTPRPAFCNWYSKSLMTTACCCLT
jgi:hypothetical protein